MDKAQEVKKIIVGTNTTTEQKVEELVKLFSPPPVVGDLREKIARLIHAEFHEGTTEWEDTGKIIQGFYFKTADSILAILADSKQEVAKIESILLNTNLTMGRKLMAITDVIANLKASPNNI